MNRSPLHIALFALALACGDDDAQQDTDTDGPASGEVVLGPCARILDCATASDRPVTQLLAQYGEDGRCWDEFPTEACWQDCRAFLSDEACAVSDLCCECASAEDCAYDPQTPICLAGSCVAEVGADDTGGTGSGGGDVEFPATDFLVLLSLSVAPTTPIQLTGTVTSQGGTLSLDLEYLALDVGSSSAPRTPTGQSLQIDDVAVTDDGTFEFSAGEVMIDGAANPITGDDITMSFSVAGQLGSDRICGMLAGSVTAPQMLDLSGSTFSGVPVGDGDLPPAADATCG